MIYRSILKPNTILIICFFLVIVGVLYFSWIWSPRFSLNSFVPHWLAAWADDHANDNKRTAVPLAILGFISAAFLLLNKVIKLKVWCATWMGLTLVVLFAELGQLLLPLRSFDWLDVYWGGLGSGLPLILTYSLKQVINSKNKVI